MLCNVGLRRVKLSDFDALTFFIFVLSRAKQREGNSRAPFYIRVDLMSVYENQIYSSLCVHQCFEYL